MQVPGGHTCQGGEERHREGCHGMKRTLGRGTWHQLLHLGHHWISLKSAWRGSEWAQWGDIPPPPEHAVPGGGAECCSLWCLPGCFTRGLVAESGCLGRATLGKCPSPSRSPSPSGSSHTTAVHISLPVKRDLIRNVCFPQSGCCEDRIKWQMSRYLLSTEDSLLLAAWGFSFFSNQRLTTYGSWARSGLHPDSLLFSLKSKIFKRLLEEEEQLGNKGKEKEKQKRTWCQGLYLLCKA